MATQGLTVAVTGPTGDLGIAVVDALERSRKVKRIVGIARRPFDPADEGWKKTEYREGDVRPKSVRDAVKGADVVVHLAFAILDASDATLELNVEGSRSVFEESAKAGVERIAYASSVAAYGFHDDNPDWLTEDIEPRGTPEHPYSAQKAEVEGVLAQVLLRRRKTVAYAFRPCIVAGPTARTMIEEIPYVRLGDSMPDAVRSFLVEHADPQAGDPRPRHPLPARPRGRRGVGLPGRRAGQGRARPLQPRRPRDAPDQRSRRRARLVLGPGARPGGGRHRGGGQRLPLPAATAWIHSVRKPVLMKTDRAQKLLRWKPKHTAKATLKEMVEAHRATPHAGAVAAVSD